MLHSVQVKIIDSKIAQDARFGLPKRATAGSAALDLRACIEAPVTIAPAQTQLVNTGIAVYIEDPNYAGLILPRSGLGHKHGLVLGNLVGLIDADYQGELMVSIWNRSTTAYTLQPGERMAQYVVVPIARPEFCVVDDFSAPSERGSGGFGHSGQG